MLHASETWPLTKPNLQRLQRNDRAMIRQICNVKPQDTVTTRSNELLLRLGIEDLDLIRKERRLRWYGHMERSNGAVKTAFDIQVDGKHGPGRPKITWKQLTERDCRERKLSVINPHDRHTWRSGVRSAMRAALTVLGFNDTSTLEGHFVLSPREREKRDRRESRGDEREGQGRMRNRNESEETEEIKTFPLYPYPLQG